MLHLSFQEYFFFVLAACAGALSRATLSAWVEKVARDLAKRKEQKGSTEMTASFTHANTAPKRHNYIKKHLRAQSFPWGVFTVNILGCLGFGLAYAVTEYSFPLEPAQKTILFTGFFGAFTTFSTFIFEIYFLWRDREFLKFFLFVFGQITIGVFFIFALLRIFLIFNIDN